jgi:hypothetical protein
MVDNVSGPSIFSYGGTGAPPPEIPPVVPHRQAHASGPQPGSMGQEGGLLSSKDVEKLVAPLIAPLEEAAGDEAAKDVFASILGSLQSVRFVDTSLVAADFPAMSAKEYGSFLERNLKIAAAIVHFGFELSTDGTKGSIDTQISGFRTKLIDKAVEVYKLEWAIERQGPQAHLLRYSGEEAGNDWLALMYKRLSLMGDMADIGKEADFKSMSGQAIDYYLEGHGRTDEGREVQYKSADILSFANVQAAVETGVGYFVEDSFPKLLGKPETQQRLEQGETVEGQDHWDVLVKGGPDSMIEAVFDEALAFFKTNTTHEEPTHQRIDWMMSFNTASLALRGKYAVTPNPEGGYEVKGKIEYHFADVYDFATLSNTENFKSFKLPFFTAVDDRHGVALEEGTIAHSYGQYAAWHSDFSLSLDKHGNALSDPVIGPRVEGFAEPGSAGVWPNRSTEADIDGATTTTWHDTYLFKDQTRIPGSPGQPRPLDYDGSSNWVGGVPEGHFPTEN